VERFACLPRLLRQGYGFGVNVASGEDTTGTWTNSVNGRLITKKTIKKVKNDNKTHNRTGPTQLHNRRRSLDGI
jgi:hypothetical protein